MIGLTLTIDDILITDQGLREDGDPGGQADQGPGDIRPPHHGWPGGGG